MRLIEPADNAALAAIIRASIEEFGVPTEGTAHTDPTTDNLHQLFRTPGSVYWVEEQEGTLLGGCGIYPTEGLSPGYAELVRFFLTASARGKGLGKALMQRSLDSARELGYTHVYLETFGEMSAAVGMYEKMGFRVIDAPLGNSGHYSCTVWMVMGL